MGSPGRSSPCGPISATLATRITLESAPLRLLDQGGNAEARTARRTRLGGPALAPGPAGFAHPGTIFVCTYFGALGCRAKQDKTLASGGRRSLDRRRVLAMKPVAEAEEDRQSLIYGSYLFPRKFTEDAPDSPLVD